MTQAIDNTIDTEHPSSSTLAMATESPMIQKANVLTKSLSTFDQQPEHKRDDDCTDTNAANQDSTFSDQTEVEEESSKESALESDQNEPKPESEPLSPTTNLLEAAVSSASGEIFAVVAQEAVEDILPVLAADTQTKTEPILPSPSEQAPTDEHMTEKGEDTLPPRSFSPAYSCSSPSPSPSPAPSPALSRVSSRQDLRRKSSFFNSKEIVISNQRYSTGTYDSMRPVADPRFKSRFQNILSQWKARTSNQS
ncbi:hypothetical protein EMPS_10530 [Entomortierella parvispora]|uniref:Uncharacterized protein n=1 Tax=Entomortierella parvispora TaxID=205924 RepID=A0A9P3HKB2_9FUNG|nr:hypothetical protein EMPS_10530 [Entomortierella parvispora]